MTSNPFEMPPEMKALAEQSIAAARKAFGGYMDAAVRALGAFEGAAGARRLGASDLGRKAVDFAQENMNATLGFMEKLMRARDPDEIVGLQGEFAREQMQRLTEQTQALADAAARNMGRTP